MKCNERSWKYLLEATENALFARNVVGIFPGIVE